MTLRNAQSVIDDPANVESDPPEGWTEALLSELAAKIQYGYTASASQDSQGPRFLRITDIQNGRVDWESVPSCVIDPPNLEKFELQEGDIVFARTGATTGKSFLIRSCPTRSVFASYLIRLRPVIGVNSAFLSLFFQTPQYWQFISENVAGNAQPNCNASKLANLTVSLPPIAEQQRVVEKVENLLSFVAATRERLARVLPILRRFRQAVLAAACSGRLTADWRDTAREMTPVERSVQEILKSREEHWLIDYGDSKRYLPPREVWGGVKNELPNQWGCLSSDALFSFVTSGSRGWARYYADQGAAYIRVGNLDHDTIGLDLSEIQHVNPRASAERERTAVSPGDILVSITAEIGMVALVPSDIDEAYVNQHVAIARPVLGFNPAYLAWFLVAPNGGQVQFQELQRGATKTGLGLDDVRSLNVPLPPIEEQNEIVRRIEALFELADAIEKRVAAATARAEKLTQAILAKAFRGELVPTEAELARREGRSYEPASALLARIRAERESSGGSRAIHHPRKR